MARPFPYAFIACPCSESPIPDSLDDDQTLDPRSPRSNFSLYPPEQLLYCEDCHQIKCPRCITEEIVCWYCPSCLFETPSSMVRSEGNRCARNCFNCPVCTAPLAVTTLENATGSSQQGPWVLACSYCMWTTLDVGLQFDKPTNLRAQLSKMTDASRGRQPSKTFSDLKSPLATSASIDDQLDNISSPNPPSTPAPESPLAPDARFAALKSFYKDQLAAVSSSSSDPDLGSPGALHRIMSLYASSSRFSLYPGAGKKPKSRPPVMREAISASEGLKVPAPDVDDAAIQRLVAEDGGWDSVASLEQRRFQSPDARFVDDLLPLPVLLRTKRSKRCKSCKHILVKPEFKPSSTRFRIRLIALSYIPLPTLRPLIPTPGLLPPSSLPSAVTSSVAPNLDALPPLKPVQLLLTLKNHMFDPVRVTLATPSVTPGRVASKVTILCPQFDLGANSDVWDEALQGATPAGGAGGGSASATSTVNDPRSSRSGTLGGAGSSEKVAEAGKVWDKGRNWTTVVLEVVPGPLPGGGQKSSPMRTGDDDTYEENKSKNKNKNKNADSDSNDDDDSDDDDSLPDMKNLDWSGQNTDPGQYLQPDEDILEIPVFVRMEWDSDNQIDEHGGGHQSSDTVKRELAYWMVLGVGKISKELTA